MSAYYFDTSALVKRYVAEVGSIWVRSGVARRLGHVSYASVLGNVGR
jgi:predicted nucleic acid-binding protein